VVVLFAVVRVHPQVVKLEFLPYSLLENGTFLQCQAVALRNDRHHIDELAQLLEHDNVDGLERVARRRDEEQAAVDARVLEISVTLGGELLAEVGAVLVLDVLDDRVPAALVVDQVAVAGCVDDVEAEAHAVLLDVVRDALDLRGAADGLVGRQAALAVQEMRGKDGVDECRFTESSLACATHVRDAIHSTV
jgi:hypothetical protein